MENAMKHKAVVPLVFVALLLLATGASQYVPAEGGAAAFTENAVASIRLADVGSPSADIRGFTGTRQGRDVLVQWTAQREQSVQIYEIQRASSSSRGWERIGSMSGVNGSMPQTYTFIDRNAPAEHLRYMMRNIGHNDDILYSDIITASLESTVSSFSVSPEPSGVANTYIVSLGLNKPAAISLKLVDGDGRIIRRLQADERLTSGIHTFPIDCSQHSPGSYALRLEAPEGDFHRTLLIGK